MLHGLGGTPKDFANLYPLFDENEYTIIIPNDPTNISMGLVHSTNKILVEVSKIIEERNHSTCTKKLSIIGNSLGGLIAKLLVVKLNQINTSLVHFKCENFITIVTPHHGLSGDYTPGNLVRLLISYLVLGKTGEDLRSNNIVNMTETSEFKEVVKRFKRRITYGLSTISILGIHWSLDFVVPYWSSTMKSNISPNIEGYNSGIWNQSITSNEIEWDMHIVKLFSCLNHGNVSGKHLNKGLVSFNKESVLKSIKHIRDQFINEPTRQHICCVDALTRGKRIMCESCKRLICEEHERMFKVEYDTRKTLCLSCFNEATTYNWTFDLKNMDIIPPGPVPRTPTMTNQ